MVSEKIHSKNNILFFAILCLVSNIVSILFIIAIIHYKKIINNEMINNTSDTSTDAHHSDYNILARVIFVKFLVMNLFLFFGIRNVCTPCCTHFIKYLLKFLPLRRVNLIS